MLTVRHLEKLWKSGAYSQLLHEMLAGRTEASLRLEQELSGSLPAVSMVLLRLDELSQSHVPLYSRLLQSILNSQQSDGGWGDPLTTALCLRALFAGRGQGNSIDRGLFYLAQLQKPEGIWPNVPIRRMPADPFVSAFILMQLGSDVRFRAAVRFIDAINWFESNEHALDTETRRLWDLASVRCQMQQRPLSISQPMLSWS